MRDYLSTRFGVNPRKLRQGLWERIARRIPARWWAFYYAWIALRSPEFEKALGTVREISQDPSSRSLSTWGDINRLTVSNQQWGENMYRGLAARVKMGSRKPETSLLVELAYLAYRRKKNGI
jgi:hypothetical protein